MKMYSEHNMVKALVNDLSNGEAQCWKHQTNKMSLPNAGILVRALKKSSPIFTKWREMTVSAIAVSDEITSKQPDFTFANRKSHT